MCQIFMVVSFFTIDNKELYLTDTNTDILLYLTELILDIHIIRRKLKTINFEKLVWLKLFKTVNYNWKLTNEVILPPK